MSVSVIVAACDGCCSTLATSFILIDWVPPACFAIDILGVTYYADYGSLTINDSGSLPVYATNVWRFIVSAPVAGGSLYSDSGCTTYDSPILGFTSYFVVTYDTGTTLYTVIAYSDGYGTGDQIFNGTGAAGSISNTLGAGSITLTV